MVAESTKPISIFDRININEDGEVLCFATYLSDNDYANKTCWNYVSDLRSLLNFHRETYNEPMLASTLTANAVTEWKRHMRTDLRLSPSTVNRRLAACRAFCRWAVAEGLAKSDPTARIKQVHRVQGDPRSLDRNQRNALLRAVERHASPRDRALIHLMLFVGLRVSEAVNLDIRDVTLSERAGRLYVRQGKGSKDATLSLSATVRASLRAYLEVRPECAHSKVFVSQLGHKPLSVDAAHDVACKFGRLAGIANLTPHMLRHSTAAMLVEAGVHMSVIQATLRHASIATTARYTMARQADVDAALLSIDE